MTMRDPSLKVQITDLSEKLDPLIAPLDNDQLLTLVIEAIREYRRLLQCAEDAHQQWEQAKSALASEHCRLKELERTYLNALKSHQAQMNLVVALTDRLGYIPTIDQEGPSEEE
ncbi:transcriptional repressor TraM [Aquamicrobium sp. NLF2-7]|uniref:transcriptional repressor TraM n=1 Tax=Aquamicrobium sp. NLF2-7 TaxID=2918753 RepID=UPI001EFB1080|nr:transcriptional repressor TraM [Aquamicrobium sp. NLF2-7]MCG8274204.1 transcriptional repressor TraM [Aquamicrobium sp. NLF2-7]